MPFTTASSLPLSVLRHGPHLSLRTLSPTFSISLYLSNLRAQAIGVMAFCTVVSLTALCGRPLLHPLIQVTPLVTVAHIPLTPVSRRLAAACIPFALTCCIYCPAHTCNSTSQPLLTFQSPMLTVSTSPQCHSAVTAPVTGTRPTPARSLWFCIFTTICLHYISLGFHTFRRCLHPSSHVFLHQVAFSIPVRRFASLSSLFSLQLTRFAYSPSFSASWFTGLLLTRHCFHYSSLDLHPPSCCCTFALSFQSTQSVSSFRLARSA